MRRRTERKKLTLTVLEKTEKTEGMVEGGSLEIRNSSRRCLQGERSLRRSCLRQVAAGAAQGRGSSGGEGGDGVAKSCLEAL